MEGLAVRNPWRGGVLDGFWPLPYTRIAKEMNHRSRDLLLFLILPPCLVRSQQR
jgi:hypothetical protein